LTIVQLGRILMQLSLQIKSYYVYKNISVHVFIRGSSECGLPGSYAMWLGRWIPRLRRKVVPQYTM